jgi:tetratricopeptide (TPR) repeat protein
MDDIHLSRQILRGVEQGRLPRSFLEEIATEHLLSLCPHCRKEFEAFEAERRAGTSIVRQLSLVVSTLLRQLRSVVPQILSRAERDLQDLLPLPPDERSRRIERARSRFRGPALVKLLLEESRRCIPARPGEAFRFADLARQIANRSPQEPEYFELYVLATSSMANACRVENDRRMADQLFALARQVITEHGVTDPEVVARVDDLLGSLRKDQRRFPEAERLLKRAAAQFSLIQAADDAARALIKLGDTYELAGSLDRAIETTRSALALLGPESEPRLHLCARFNLAQQLVHAGQYEEASARLEEDEELFRGFPELWTQLRIVWLRGDIAAGQGDLDAAERSYLTAREGFVAQGSGYDAAMVSLDLAVLYLRRGRAAEVRRIAEEMLPIFQAQDIHREALAALTLFQEAARRDQLTIEQAQEIAAYLREARKEPELSFGGSKFRSGRRGSAGK